MGSNILENYKKKFEEWFDDVKSRPLAEKSEEVHDFTLCDVYRNSNDTSKILSELDEHIFE